jgi:hypothetical protein
MEWMPPQGTASSLRGLRGLHETIATHGLFSSFYTDRGSHYFVTLKAAGAAVDKAHLTQVGRGPGAARHQPPPGLFAPEARGRMEPASSAPSRTG